MVQLTVQDLEAAFRLIKRQPPDIISILRITNLVKVFNEIDLYSFPDTTPYFTEDAKRYVSERTNTPIDDPDFANELEGTLQDIEKGIIYKLQQVFDTRKSPEFRKLIAKIIPTLFIKETIKSRRFSPKEMQHNKESLKIAMRKAKAPTKRRFARVYSSR